jgi:hypothetical protein
MTARRFPPPWSVEEGETYFVVRDHDGQELTYVHFDDPRSADKPLTRDEARRIAANIAVAGAIAQAVREKPGSHRLDSFARSGTIGKPCVRQ